MNQVELNMQYVFTISDYQVLLNSLYSRTYAQTSNSRVWKLKMFKNSIFLIWEDYEKALMSSCIFKLNIRKGLRFPPKIVDILRIRFLYLTLSSSFPFSFRLFFWRIPSLSLLGQKRLTFLSFVSFFERRMVRCICWHTAFLGKDK